MAIAYPSHSAPKWLVLAVVVAAQFIFVVDAFIVNVAIPSIRTDLAATTGEIQGVIVLYMIAFATLVVTGGRLGDIHGSKPIFLCGLIGFTAASLWCGLAHSGSELVLARTAQGAAAALMIPQVLATMHLLFHDEERGRAFGIYGTTLGLGGAVGFGLGGSLVALDFARLGWRSIFFVNVPIGLALIAAALCLMPPMPRKSCVRLDVIGSCVLFLALLSLIGPLLLGRDLAWPPWLFAMMGTGVFLLAVLWRLERLLERRGGLPLVHLGLLTDKSFATGLLSVFFFTFANISFYLVMTLYMQLGLGFTPLQSGAVILPLTVAFAFASRRAGPRAQQRGATAVIEGCGVEIAGVAVVGLAVALNGRLDPIVLSCLLILFGIGQGMVMAPLYSLVLSKVPPVHAGSGAGVVSTIQQVGNAAGVAAIGSLYFAMQAGHSDRYAIVLSLGVLAAAVAMSAGLLGILRRPRAWSSQRAP